MNEAHHSLIQEEAVRIDCRGVNIDRPVLDVLHDGRLFQYVMDERLRNATTFHAGLFVNLQVMSDDALVYPTSQRFCALLESPINACYSSMDELQRRYQIVFTHQNDLLDRALPSNR